MPKLDSPAASQTSSRPGNGSGPKVTVAFVPRETVSNTVRSLTSIVELTRGDFDLVCIAAGYPDEIVGEVRRLAARRNGRVQHFDHYLTPNQARNAAARLVNTRYVVFIDNDVLVTPDWLTRLVAAAEETGAMIAAPLVYEREPERRYIHMAGGEARVLPTPEGGRCYHEKHHQAGLDVRTLTEGLSRRETELVEFHTMLVDMQVFDRFGPLDEKLLSVAEHWDLCLTVRNAGGRVIIEPASEVTYSPPTRLTAADAQFFNLRWSYEWLNGSLERLAEKHRLAPRGNRLDTITKWVAGHRLHQYGRANSLLRKLAGARLGRSISKRALGAYDRAANPARIRGDYRRWLDAVSRSRGA